MCGSYVLAGFEGLADIIYRFITFSEEYNNNFKPEDIKNFFDLTCTKFLHSYGQNFKGKKKYNKYNRKEAELFQWARNLGYFSEKCEMIADSGAYQISMGILNRKESELLSVMYYEFLEEYPEYYDRAFILDLPPGPQCQMFSTFNDVYNLNMKSFTKAANFPKEIRDKIIYIHHFRTPKIWDICVDILDTDNMFDKFQHFATGGIAANMRGDMSIPCIIYVLPLVVLLNRTLKFKRKSLSFHVLGGATYRDILFYELFKKVVKDKHDIDLTITYDTSVIFKALMIGRYIPIIDDGIVKRTDLRSETINLKFNDKETILNAFIRTLITFSEKFGFKKFDLEHIYDTKTNSFYETVRVYAMLYHIYMYYEIENSMKQMSDYIYPFYKNGDIEEFNRLIEEQTRKMNGNKITKKQMIKSYSVSKSLDVLTSLDEDYCKYVTNKFLARDEFVDLSGDALLKF